MIASSFLDHAVYESLVPTENVFGENCSDAPEKGSTSQSSNGVMHNIKRFRMFCGSKFLHLILVIIINIYNAHNFSNQQSLGGAL